MYPHKHIGCSATRQGKEGNICLLSFTVASGVKRLRQDQYLPISYVVNKHQFKAMIMHVRIMQVCVGAFGAFPQAYKDTLGNHRAAHRRNKLLFNFINEVARPDSVMSQSKLRFFQTHDRQLNADDNLTTFKEYHSKVGGSSFTIAIPECQAFSQSNNWLIELGSSGMTGTFNAPKAIGTAPESIKLTGNGEEDGTLARKKKNRQNVVENRKKAQRGDDDDDGKANDDSNGKGNDKNDAGATGADQADQS